MRNAVILDYSDGTINILPIPQEIQENGRDTDYIESHPAYDADECSYMIVDGDINIFKASTEESALVYTIPEEL